MTSIEANAHDRASHLAARNGSGDVLLSEVRREARQDVLGELLQYLGGGTSGIAQVEGHMMNPELGEGPKLGKEAVAFQAITKKNR